MKKFDTSMKYKKIFQGINIEFWLLDQMTVYCKKHNWTKTKLIHEALKTFLASSSNHNEEAK